jgi:Methylamine utilisation protein MauE
MLNFGVVVVQIGLAATLAFAGTAKLLDPAPFERVLRQSGLPSRAAGAAATGLPLLELLLGAALIGVGGSVLRWVLAAAAAVFLAFCTWMLVVRLRRLELSCGCFGSRSKRVDGVSLLRTMSLASLAIGASAVGVGGIYDHVSIASLTIGSVIVAVLAAGVSVRHLRPRMVTTSEDFENVVRSESM